MLAQLKQEYPDVYFLSLTVEEKDDRAKVEGWLKKAGAEGLNAGKASFAKFDELRTAAKRGNGIPANVFITRDGKAIEYLVGRHDHGTMAKLAERISR